MIFLLRQLWLEWPNCCSTLFLAILLKYLAFPPCTCCDCLHYIVVYVLSFHIGQFYCIFFAILALGHFSYCPLLGHRFESSPFCQLWHLLAPWNSGLSNVDADRYGVVFIVAPYGWRGIYILDFLLFFMITHFVYCYWQLHVLRNYVILAYFATVSCCSYQGQVLCIALASLIGSVCTSAPLQYIHQNARI